MYKLIIEYFLGFNKKGNLLELNPCIPEEWEKFSISYKFGNAVYEIEITQDKNIHETTITVDGVPQKDKSIDLSDKEGNYRVQILLPALINFPVPVNYF
jgi:cellobiose phosphorylase